jgi:hypothetical protein
MKQLGNDQEMKRQRDCQQADEKVEKKFTLTKEQQRRKFHL